MNSGNLPEINYVVADKIDKEKWDKAIATAPNGVVYAFSNYLDALAGTWDAMIIGDYKMVMPLPWRKKLGIQYLFQPDLTPVLGLFGEGVNREFFKRCLSSIPKKFKLWDISLNHQNEVPVGEYPVYRRSNYVLSLKEDYEILKSRFNNNCLRNIRKASHAGSVLKTGIDIQEIITLSREQFKTFTDFDEKNFEVLAKIFHHYLDQHHAKTYGVYDKNNKLLASSAFLFSHKRVYYWLVGNHPAAKEVAASYLLIDTFIRDHAGKDLVLDFEGSDTDSIAKFYRSFGATDEPYSTIYFSRLPKIFKWFKKDPYRQ